MRTIWLRKEVKPGEERTPLTPKGVYQLIQRGHPVVIESCCQRAFQDRDYAVLGATLTFESFEKAPHDALILGLKELPQSNSPVTHDHLFFAHIFKGQEDSQQVLNRFKQGGGRLFDLEFLTDSQAKRIATFGHWAGLVGAFLGLKFWLNQKNQQITLPVSSYDSAENLMQQVQLGPLRPKALILGGQGRSSRGAQHFFRKIGLDYDVWGRQETTGRKNIQEILDYDILVNCVYIEEKIPPFLTFDFISQNPQRKLSMISDVSCDPGALNPLPLYSTPTTLKRPIKTILTGDNPLELTAIDHLPSLLPRESSLDFEAQLLPHLFDFLNAKADPFERAYDLFSSKLSSSLDLASL